MPAWGWIMAAALGLAAIVGLALLAVWGPLASTQTASQDEQDQAQESADAMEVLWDTEASDGKQPLVGEQPGDETPEQQPGESGRATDEPARPPDLPASSEPKVARSLEEVLEAIVKFEVPLAGETRVQYGCGFLVDGRGWIATNHHVVASATTAARVAFADGTRSKLAGVVVRSPEHDLAVVKLEDPPAKLTILDLGYEGSPRLGAQVYAFGHPYNADFSLSKGIVSRVLTTADLLAGPQGRVVAAMKAPEDLVWIQHDAKISPGNSGGPLLEEGGGVVGVNTFINVKAEFGYASHVEYLRELLATASEQITPLPPPERIAQEAETGQPPLRPGRVVISTGRMRQLFDAASSFGWTPQQPEQYETLADLAKQMTLAKHLPVTPGATRAPPQAIRGMIELADQLFGRMRTAGWGPEKSKAINQFAVQEIDTPGEGTIVLATVVLSVRDSLLLEIQGTGRHVLVPVGRSLSSSPRGTQWLVIGVVTPRTAQLEIRNRPEKQRLPIVLTHYMLKVR